jgi:hypothetical protein
MKIDFSQKLYDIKGKVMYELTTSVISGNLPLWLNETYNAFKSGNNDILEKQLEMIKDVEAPKELTLATVCIEALCEPQDDARKMSETDKLKLSELARKIYSAVEPVSIDEKEAAIILKRLNKNIYGANIIIFSQAKNMLILENNPENKKRADR